MLEDRQFEISIAATYGIADAADALATAASGRAGGAVALTLQTTQPDDETPPARQLERLFGSIAQGVERHNEP